jgi:HSP90 family molecular chaperone
VLDTEKKESIKTLLLALWKKDNETFNRSEYVALSNALQLYYEVPSRSSHEEGEGSLSNALILFMSSYNGILLKY